jgi:glycosyltransferase involved in cell wall biosynthesis
MTTANPILPLNACESPTPESLVFDVSIVMPCLNEAETIAQCIREAQQALDTSGLAGEVVIADNGSQDGSQEIASGMGARVVPVAAKGYGNALRGGIEAARGEYVVFADADASYNFGDAPKIVEKLREGYDLVMGNRFRGGIEPGAMPPLHRYLGNPVLSGIGRLFYGCPVGDFHCGLRGFRKTAYPRMGLNTTGMEFASEMVIKSTLQGLRITEIPTTLRPDGRSRPPHLRSWRDGWRHLRFMLLLSPRWLFFYPGLCLFLVGLIGLTILWNGPVRWGRAAFDIHTMLIAGSTMLVGYQSLFAAVFTRCLAARLGLCPPKPALDRWMQAVTLERGVILGGIFCLLGVAGLAAETWFWGDAAYGALPVRQSMRLVIPSVVGLMLGVQTILGSFFLSVLSLVPERSR